MDTVIFILITAINIDIERDDGELTTGGQHKGDTWTCVRIEI